MVEGPPWYVRKVKDIQLPINHVTAFCPTCGRDTNQCQSNNHNPVAPRCLGCSGVSITSPALCEECGGSGVDVRAGVPLTGA